MLDHVFKEYDETTVNRIDMTLQYLRIGLRSPNSLEKIYMEMLNMPLPKENICLEFINARIPFPLVVGLGDLELVEGMISNGIDVNMPMLGNYKALHMACLQGNLKMAELLLKYEADVNATDGSQRTPLGALFDEISLCRQIDVHDCYRMTRLLVSYGAKLGPFDKEAMINAIQFANLDTLKLLVNEANGDLNYRSMALGYTCLHAAVLNRQPGVLEYLVKRGNVDIDSHNQWRWTPLMMASRPEIHNHYAVKILLKLGADFRIENGKGLTSFDQLTKGKRNPELAWLYFDLGFDILGSDEALLDRAVKSESPWLEDIIAEIAKKETMGARIVGKNQKVFNQCRMARCHRRLCQEQLREMQKRKFYENVSFWDVLSADRTRLMEYAENLELLKAFFDAKCNGSFPIYCARIRHKFIEMLSKNRLIDLSTPVVCDMIKIPTMHEIMQHEVMTHMKDDDFVKILGCCRKP